MKGFLSIYKCGKELDKFLEENGMKISLNEVRIGEKLIQTYFAELVGKTNSVGISCDLIKLPKPIDKFDFY